MPRAAEPRRTPPLGAQLDAAKRQIIRLMQRIGEIPADASPESVKLECDHDPALGLRDVCPESGRHIPHQHDPVALVFRVEAIHDVKTRGRGATTAGSDVGEMRKTRQLVKARVERGEIAADDPSISPWAPNPNTRPTPKRTLAGRGLTKHPTLKRGFNGKVVPRDAGGRRNTPSPNR